MNEKNMLCHFDIDDAIEDLQHLENLIEEHLGADPFEFNPLPDVVQLLKSLDAEIATLKVELQDNDLLIDAMAHDIAALEKSKWISVADELPPDKKGFWSWNGSTVQLLQPGHSYNVGWYKSHNHSTGKNVAHNTTQLATPAITTGGREMNWKYDPRRQRVTTEDGELLIADIRGWGRLQQSLDGDKIQDYHGRLVAAAPELLEMAHRFKDYLEQDGTLCHCGGSDCKSTQLLKLIDKVGGV